MGLPNGYGLTLFKHPNCILCERPEFRKEFDEIIWSREYTAKAIKNLISEELNIYISEKEITTHSKHLKLVPTDKNIAMNEAKIQQDKMVDREKEMLAIEDKRKLIEYDYAGGLDNLIKILNSEINELKLQGLESTQSYIKKVEQYRKLLEMKYKKEDVIKDDRVSFAVLEVRELFDALKELKENETSQRKPN